ncbi:MAG: site-specific integrase [Roseomonas sp.]|nr:site-specific integrase [Roseomonas sp.]
MVRWSDLQLGELRAGTQARYKTSLAQLDKHFAGRPLAGIKPVDINNYAVARMQGGVSAATVRRDLTVANRVLRVAKRAGWIGTNPVPDEAAELPERREPIQPVPLRVLATVLRAAPRRFGQLIRFLALTGCRMEEAAGLPVDAVNLARGTVTFSRTKTRSPRVIQLRPGALRLLRSMDLPGTPGTLVFRSDRTKERFNNVSGQFRALVARCDVPHFRAHDLRHTFGIRWLQGGGDIYDLSRYLGHTSVKTTEIYTKWLSLPLSGPGTNAGTAGSRNRRKA